MPHEHHDLASSEHCFVQDIMDHHSCLRSLNRIVIVSGLVPGPLHCASYSDLTTPSDWKRNAGVGDCYIGGHLDVKQEMMWGFHSERGSWPLR